MKPGYTPLSNNKNYRDFITERNKALEYILFHYQGLVDREVDKCRIRVEQIALHLYTISKNSPIDWNHALAGPFNLAIKSSVALIQRMRATVYALSFVGEAEGIGRALGKKADASLRKHNLHKVTGKPSPSGGDLERRITLGFRRIQRDVIDTLESSVLTEQNAQYILDDIGFAFPKTRAVRPPGIKKLVTKQIKEARKPSDKKTGLISGFIDDDVWDQVVQDYLDAEIPTRGPEDQVTIVSPGKGEEERYTWEVEQEITQDFLNQVRDGQIDAAKQNGIEEFMWISIIDKKTDECCDWRHGLTSSEIESALNDEHSDDDCDAVVPPAHFNCRCNLAPVTSEVMDEEPLELGDFDSWLK